MGTETRAFCGSDVDPEKADIQLNHRVLEPSAGTGAIVDAIRAAIQAAGGQCDIEAVEIKPDSGPQAGLP